MPVELRPGELFALPDVRVSFEYRGKRCGDLDFDTELARRFVDTADIRHPIKIVQQKLALPQNTRYGVSPTHQQTGTSMGEDRFSTLNFDHGQWIVTINGGLLEQISTRSSEQNASGAFVRRLNREISGALASVVLREKLLNAGHYTLPLLMAYATTFVNLTYAVKAGEKLTAGYTEPYSTVIGALATYCLINSIFNGSDYLIVKVNQGGHIDEETLDSLPNPLLRAAGKLIFSSNRDAYVKRTIPEIILVPSVAVDRIARGMAFLGVYGRNFVRLK